MTIVNIHAAKTNFSSLVDQAAAGEEIIIAKAGRPVARLMPLERPRGIRFGLLEGRAVVPNDFDDPLPDWLLDAFEGKDPSEGR